MKTICSGLYGEMNYHMYIINPSLTFTKSQIRKIIKTISFVFISMLLLTSCDDKVKEESLLCKEAKEEADQVFEYLKEEDIQSLSELFSPNKQTTYNLEAEWKSFFESLDGKIKDYDCLKFDEAQRTFSDGKLYYLTVNVEFTNIETETGHIYEELSYSKILKSDSNNDEEGIWGVSFVNGRDEKGNLNMTYIGCSKEIKIK